MKDIALKQHKHGGQLGQASEHYQIPLSDWMDLSTGISPFTYPLPKAPDECWQRLPETNDGLEKAAAGYYGSEFLLPVSGSQEAIQALPKLFSTPCKVGLVTPAYHSHKEAWQKSGHEIILFSPDEIDKIISSIDILVLVNPTNPSTQTYAQTHLLKWHEQLASKNGYLIVDEAFIDSTPQNSLISKDPIPGLIVLRSLGKFFGLAGIRLGFVWAKLEILQTLASEQDDWSVSHPARWAGKIALADFEWQQQQRKTLTESSIRLEELLQTFLNAYPINKDQPNIYAKSGGVSFNTNYGSNGVAYRVKKTTLFAYFKHPDAELIHESLCTKGILTRLFRSSNSDTEATQHSFQKEPALRFGLPANEAEWQRLEITLNDLTHRVSHD